MLLWCGFKKCSGSASALRPAKKEPHDLPNPPPQGHPGKSAGIPKPNMNLKRYPGFVLENQETGRASAERRKAVAKASI